MMWVLLLILKIILYLLAALLLLLLTLLIVPFSYKGEAEVYGGVTFNFRVGWFWNLFNIRGSKSGDDQVTAVYLGNKRLVALNTKAESVTEEKPEKAEDSEKAAAKKENNFRSFLDTNLIREALSYLKKIVKQISPKDLHLHGTFGFDDPSATGMAAGFIYTLNGIWPQSRIHLQPCFTDEILELELKASGNIYAGRLVWDTARFLLKKDIRSKIFKRNKKVKQKAH